MEREQACSSMSPIGTASRERYHGWARIKSVTTFRSLRFARVADWLRRRTAPIFKLSARADPLLSKTKYLIGLQCSKALWINYNDIALLPAIDARTEALFQQGHEVGLLAQKLFPNGINIGHLRGFDEPVEATRIALAARRPLFEAAFIYNRCFSRADILEPIGLDEWDIIEVKSATDVKPINLHDLAFQHHVYEGNGLRIRRCYIVHINNQYIRTGAINPAALLSRIDVTKEVGELLPAVPSKVNDMVRVIDLASRPEVKISRHCNAPYECSLKPFCWKFLPNPNVFDLRRAGKKPWELLEQNVTALDQIPASVVLNSMQQRQIESHRSGKIHVDSIAINGFVKRLAYPLHFLDFETIAPAVPFYDLARPYVQIPFQFSLHIVESEGDAPTHVEFLADGQMDPRPELLKRLRNQLGEAGSIVGYNVDFEVNCLRECAAVFPEYQSWFNSLVPRFVDLYDLFDDLSYYHPSQNGSASLKAVLPALTGINYDALEIGGGDFAQREFTRMTFGDVMPEERSRVSRALLAYCRQDTRGLIDILDALKKLTKTEC